MNNTTKTKVRQRRITPKQQRDYMCNRRIKCVAGYGGVCVCCGENKWEFLTFDHKGNDGAVHRAATGLVSNKMYLWMIHNDFPRDKYQLLCYNCNCARFHNNGVCPHVQRRPMPKVKSQKIVGRIDLVCCICQKEFSRPACRVKTPLDATVCGYVCKGKQRSIELNTPEGKEAQRKRTKEAWTPERQKKMQDAAKEWRDKNRKVKNHVYTPRKRSVTTV